MFKHFINVLVLNVLVINTAFQEINAAFRSPVTLELKEAEVCTAQKCQAPLCRCSGLPLPKQEFKGHEKEIPQFITVTFDDAVTAWNYKQCQELFANLRNPNGCDAQACFFVSHEYSDYSKVNALYNEGHEIALHSITHVVGTNYWRNASVDLLLKEFGQEIDMLEMFANINGRDIHGMRLPFLQLSANNSFIAAKKLGLLYDSSWSTQQYRDPAMWPYTLDFLSTQDCPTTPCPTVSLNGLWEYPMVPWTDTGGYICAMLDSCIILPPDVDSLFIWMKMNFLRHYNGNRAPFGMFLHAAWFDRDPNYLKAFRKFLEYANSLPDVYLVTPTAVIQYMRHPTLGEPFKGCFKKPSRPCKPVTCVLAKEKSRDMRYITVCDKCPDVYPWLDNPLGVI